MDELLTCSMNCRNKPAYVCDCSDKKVFLCQNHALSHVLSNGNHHYTEIMKKPDPQTKIIISKFIKGLKMQTKQDKLKIIQESSLLIKKINEVAAQSLGQLLAIQNKIDEYRYLCDTLEEINNLNSKSFIESLLKLSAEEAAKIAYQEDIIEINNINFKEKIENLFIVQEMKSFFDTDKFEVFKPKPIIKILKYFKNQDLFAIDVTSQNSTSQNIYKNWQGYDPTCLLDDGSVFCCFQGETFIIDSNNSIVPLDYSQYSTYSGLIAVDDFVYMFGGTGNASLKFSLKSKNWASLAQYPVSGNRFISCACINNVVLIGGYESPYIYGYNICNNSYTNNLVTLSSNSGKTCLATKDKAYIIQYGTNYFESGLNDINTWTSIGTASMLNSGNPRHSYSLLYENSFYFINCDTEFLVQFDLKSKQLILLKIL